MKKRIKKLLVTVVISTFAIIQSGASNVYAANKIGNYVLTGGVGSYGNYKRYYFITSSASSYSTAINDAMDTWIYTSTNPGVTTSISWRQTTTQSDSVMDIYYGSFFTAGILAATDFWTYSTQINPTTSNWGWGRIRLNGSSFDGLSSYNRQGTIAHEMGHVFGLDETNTETNSVMCQLGSGRTVNRASANDLNTINTMY